MLRSNVMRIGPVVMLLLLVSSVASAQSTLRVLRSAVVVAEPAGDANVVATVTSGELLEVLDERGSWYLVRPPDDGTPGDWRTGWVNQAMVELLDADTTSRSPSVSTALSQPRPSARRPTQLRGELYSYPGTETSVGWAFSNDDGLTSPLGFNVGVTNNFNPWIGVTTEGGANFYSVGVLGFEVFDAQLYTLMAPKFTLRTVDRIAPFGQLLAGVTYARGNFLGLEGDNLFFTMQPGGGIDILASDIVGLRFGFDSRIGFVSSTTARDFRFTAGVTFRSNFK